MNLEFSIASWAAFAPGLTTEAHWRWWAAEPWLPRGAGQPEVDHVPPLERRRLGQLGRMVSSVARSVHDTRSDPRSATPLAEPADDIDDRFSDIPVVLGSRYGDSARSLELLAALARGEPMSPTGFTLSVHNAIGAMYSIARGDTSNYLTLAAGSGSAAACLVEAAGLLADGAREVIVICYDAPLPAAYEEFADEPEACYAWAWRLRPAAGSARDMPLSLPSIPCIEANHIRLSFRSAADVAAPKADLPFGLDVMRFMLSNQRCLERTERATTWTWRRHG